MLELYKQELALQKQECEYRIDELKQEIRDRQQRFEEICKIRDQLDLCIYRLQQREKEHEEIAEAEGDGNG